MILSRQPGLIQFENVNEGRSYPFRDNTSLLDINGQELPDEAVADLHLVIPKNTTAYLSSVYISDYMLSLCLKVTDNTTSKTVGALSVTVKAEDFKPYTPYRLEKLTHSTLGFTSEDMGGVVTFGNVYELGYRGSFRFQDTAVAFTESTIARYTPAGVRSIIDDRTGEKLTGDIKIDFSAYVETSTTPEGIHLKLPEEASKLLLPKCQRERNVNLCGATPISSINGVTADEKNRIVLWFH